ncbi:GMC family oxidoreductase [Sphingobium chungbukense]|uniref:Glucose-methanol-choline oxidoreductase N-terminal domain-containing protein n=1 Tax=Sphingobium chungbukense TaxID=56193 RepID=A0A0M3AQG8_9SPHN|nr:GMC family oxidoreductase N-terminal domain-containing protein [Sphingobium chungbukense]KKW91166.1 hypothetical protein YP76_16435 [Sphingobium chungbukense]
MTARHHFDYVVVGGGSAGCAVASQLVAGNAGRVLLIEAGKDARTLAMRIPALVRKAISQFDWGYVSDPDDSRNGRSEAWVRGRVLGGSSGVNGMMFVRGAPSDYDRWAAKQIPGWDWKSVQPIFRALENSDRPGAERGHAGPLHVSTVKRPHPLTQAFLSAAEAAGYPLNADYNAGDQHGFGLAQLSQRRGLRNSAADAFLPAVRGMAGFTLWDQCEVQRILFNGNVATGLTCSRKGEEIVVSADRIILSSGAVGSPKLLLQSGVGDPEELAKLGIPVSLESREVGRNMLEHPLVRLVYETSIASRNLTGGIGQPISEVADYLLNRQGMLAGLFEATGFVRSQDQLDAPDIQYHFLPMGIQDPTIHADPLLKRPSLTIYANLSHPNGRGRLMLSSSDPSAPPRILPQLLGGARDTKALAAAIRIARRIMSTPPMQELATRELTPGPHVEGDAALEEHIRRNTEIAYHIAGTCRMGSDPDAVVAPDLKLNGAENMWIADASIFPDLISGNTNAACMMIGMKLGRQLVSDRVPGEKI